jgi:diguanylate cyclase (GGDEF)-like protein
MDRLRQAIAMSIRQQRSAALLFVDLDNFKVINDTYGHRFGDELLCRMSSIFAEAVRPGDTVARLGGDEFLIVLPELVDDSDAKGVAERILQRLRQPIAIGDQQIHSSASIGIAIGPRDSDDPEELMRHADIALYDAKGRGRQCYSFFDPRLNEAARRRSEVERHLRFGLARGELGIVYQPIFRPGLPAQLCGVEALVRWNSAELGPVPPDEFIRVAEEAGLIRDVGHFVMRRATAEIAALVREFGHDIKLSVNVSANELREGKLAELVDHCLREARLAPRNLMLELTESVMIENLAVVKAQLIEVRRLGASVAVDNFGTGYSSLSYLNRLPITTLKIDRSFVRDLCADAEDRALVRSIVALGHGLDMLVVAEGVESAEQVDVLSALGCDQLQGYFFSRPVDLGKLRELLTAGGAVSA